MNGMFDVVVVGARCAGSPLAMLLARSGHRVLVVDRAQFPSDTVSTHLVHPPGLAALRRWGLLDRLIATGCPPITNYVFDFGPFVISGPPGDAEMPVAYCPRRTVLDHLLVAATAEAGAEIREGFSVSEVLVEDGTVVGVRGRGAGGRPETVRARVVVGADGLRSTVARAVRAGCYHERPPLAVTYYSYWRDLPLGGSFPTYIRGDRGWAAIPTHDDLTLLVGGWPMAELEANRHDVHGTFLGTFAEAPAFLDQVQGACRETDWTGMATPNHFRKPFGPGWVLLGDAAYVKDPITAQGISDAFLQAEATAEALHAALTGARPLAEAMAEVQRARDDHALPMFEFTCQVASPDPPPAELVGLLTAVAADPDASAGFTRTWAGVLSPAEFFSPANVGRILAGAPAIA